LTCGLVRSNLALLIGDLLLYVVDVVDF
jgi:hypothetical protein